MKRARGLLHFSQVTFEVAGRPDLKLTMLVDTAGQATGQGDIAQL